MATTLSFYQEFFNRSLQNYSLPNQPAGLYDPVRFTLQSGGKRLRPVLVLISAGLFGSKPDKAFPAALAIELLHNFTLVHDDLMDQSTLRRGMATVHTKWNPSAAILSGDFLMIDAFRQFHHYPDSVQASCLEVFCKMAVTICEGQQEDIDFETSESVTIANYLEMIRKKTAVLLGASLRIGAIIGGSDEKKAVALERFGTNLGIAFQLQDDLLDTFGTSAELGKRIGGDILTNKKTYLILKAIESANPLQRKSLSNAMALTNPDKKIAQVTKCLNELNIAALTAEKMREFHQLAMEDLKELHFSEDSLLPLTELSNLLVIRKS